LTLEEMEASSGVIREVKQHLLRRGLPEHRNPELEVPVLPNDVTTVSTNKLMEYMSIFDALKTHAQYLESMADTLHNTRNAKLRLTRASKYLVAREEAEYSDRRITVKEVDAYLDTDEELLKLQHEVIMAEGYKKMVSAMREGFESKGKLLSRELTRRTSAEV